MYEIIVNMESVGEYPTFNEAFTKFMNEIMEFLNKGTSWQWLETSNFLVGKSHPEYMQIMDFYNARDLACICGLLVDGEIQQNAIEPSEEMVTNAFKSYFDEQSQVQIDMLRETLAKLSKLIREGQ